MSIQNKFENTVGKTIYLELASENDAEFIYSLRINSIYNKYLSTVTGDVESQRSWLMNYKIRERDNKEFYFIIYRKKDNLPIGTIRLYDFQLEKSSFCWGSWILNENKTNSAALESALLVYKIAFLELGFDRSHFDVRKENVKVVDFHKKFNAEIIEQTEIDYLFKYEKSEFINILKTYNRFIGM